MGRIVAVAIPPWGLQFPVSPDMTVTLPSEFEGYVYRGKLKTHAPSQCVGSYCCLHNPSDHPLKDAGMVLRLDKDTLIERYCTHGCGHPDPDSVRFLAPEGVSSGYLGVHGCDGCCDYALIPPPAERGRRERKGVKV